MNEKLLNLKGNELIRKVHYQLQNNMHKNNQFLQKRKYFENKKSAD